jgi:putative AbiEi antitoxin of type IV toxin-antitoxin system
MPDARSLSPNSSGQTDARGTDWVIARMAERQHGVVSRAQLLGAGIESHEIEYRLGVGRLHRRYRGVYCVGHDVLGRDGHRMAAVLATGPRAVLSHRGAAAAWSLWRGLYLEVTVPTHRSRRGIHVHRGLLQPDEITTGPPDSSDHGPSHGVRPRRHPSD